MGWLKRILQGSTSKSRRRSNGSCEVEDRRSCSDEPSDVEAIQEDESTEGEETDYQIASIRSFSEDGLAYNRYGAISTEDWVRYEELKWDEDEDERPVHSFQQSLAFESSSLWDIANIFQPFPYPFFPDNGQAFLPPERVQSSASHDSLTGHHEVFVSEDHSIYQNIEKDHDLNHHCRHHPRPICFVCRQPIPADANGRLLFRQHPFWRQKYCPSHETDGTPRCCGCKRLEPGGSTYSTLSDGRWLCSECCDSAVMDDRALKPLEHAVREFYERLGMKIHQRAIPLLLVSDEGIKKDKARCQMKTVEGKDHILVAHSRIQTIKVLKGFPSLSTGQTLAHEMMHAWLTLEGYHRLDGVVEEGLCEVLGHMWLDSHMRTMSKTKIALSPGFDFQKRLAEFLQYNLESNPDPVYGDGYRLMRRATDMYGLKSTLDYIRMTGSYP